MSSNRPRQAQETGGYEGVVKSFNSLKGFGFIRCQETFNKYGCDVFLHKDQLGNFAIGDNIVFSIWVNERGQPQATDLQPTAMLDNMMANGKGSASQALLDALMGVPSAPAPPTSPMDGRSPFPAQRDRHVLPPEPTEVFGMRPTSILILLLPLLLQLSRLSFLPLPLPRKSPQETFF